MSHDKLTNNETVLIVNPNSGGGATGKNGESLYNQIKKILGENPEVVFSQTSGDGTTLTRDFLRKGFRKIIALGGDGTINEVANGFFEEITSENNDRDMPVLKPINAEAILGILPSGSRNVLAKSLNLPEGIVECCQRFVSVKPQKIDVIAARVTTTPPSVPKKDHSKTIARLFLNAAELGVGAEIIDRSKEIRGKIKSRLISTISSVIATIPTYESNLCNVSIDDGESLLLKMTMGIVANGMYLGGGFKGAPYASISDGLLDITILKNSGSLKMLNEFVIMKNEVVGPRPDNDISYFQAKKVAIESKERDITVTIDGEPIGILPATFQVYRNALSVKF
ncbi:MAG: YegS/Rv2252/BmrU family lipid kinase [Candidatus Nitrosopolaris sp.]